MKEVIYKTVNDVDLRADVFEPRRGPDDDPGAAIVFFHGGGWSGGAPTQFHEHCKHLASRGMLAISAQYRLLGSTARSPFDCVADGKSAARWVRLHAAELGVDPGRVAAGGGSAGGHVAACAGVIEGLDEEGEDRDVSSTPDCLVLFNPVIDTSPSGWQRGAELLGEEAEKLSPTHHVSPGAPPCLIFHGTEDTTVPFENAARFHRLMEEAGNTCELVGFERQPHGFFNYCPVRRTGVSTEGAEASGQQGARQRRVGESAEGVERSWPECIGARMQPVRRTGQCGRDDGTCYEKTLQATDAFLVQQGFLAALPA